MVVQAENQMIGIWFACPMFSFLPRTSIFTSRAAEETKVQSINIVMLILNTSVS